MPGMFDQISTIREDPHLPAFLTVAAVFAFAFGFYWQTTGSLLAQWTDNGNYSHGLLAIAVSFYLIWQRRDELGPIPQRPHWLGLLGILGFGGLWLVAGLGNVLVVQQISVIAMLNALAFALYGPATFKVLAFPLLTIFLVTPMWDALEDPLRDLSTVVTHVALKWFSLPVLLEGYEVTVPGGRFVIEPACSGLGFFLCSGLIGAYFAYFNVLSWRWMVGLITFGLVLAVVSNWIRIIAIITVGNATQMDHWIVNDHLMFGWVLFSGMLIPYFWTGNVLLNRWQPRLGA